LGRPHFLAERLNELEAEPETLVTAARGLELRRCRVDAHDSGRARLLEPGAEVRGPATELHDILAGHVWQRAQLGPGDVADAPGDLVLRPRLRGARVCVFRVRARPSVDGRVCHWTRA
jgi:hypothetical protein